MGHARLISMFNVMIIAVLPLSYNEMLNAPQIVAHSVLASRILFNLQVSAERPLWLDDRSAISMESLSISRIHRFKAQPGGSETASQPDEARTY
ncbi:hypothetical protein BDR06DRAFT_949323 [Suillus hirtellus]|nr:hypothetical protein BDR06DRAFT_949323 [Suillus hirtellus]